ncbi:non-hydrolyzing UDP-N-acetylglucosamine 2-epimerase [Sphingomonas arenae]|uniref:non-hydrolyzing UDP-N-acetylglucosamine 2-epimerase n=1 Tax=Sphingomonas arenae TaxID=2812555 RepID=UPI00196824E9|nr:UDP-N-acetylglucosamine 2-epimerase (non-hydrolyzing) [Sphingomonas arenae]
MRIMALVGTRPEAIKMAPVTDALIARGLTPALIVTGQHPDLDPAAYGLTGEPVHRLQCQGMPDPRAHAGLVAETVAPLLATNCDLLLVHGDTSSALGGAMAAFDLGVPLGHVEAGLRSFDRANPWPEEDNRVTIDAYASLLFAPTDTSAANLVREGLSGEIHVTGNTAIDALQRVVGPLPQRSDRRPDKPKLLVTCHRRENWGTKLTPIALALLDIARSGLAQVEVVLHPNPAMADAVRLFLAEEPGVTLLPPLPHGEMIAAMRRATVILSDSGGVQEEAPALGVPLLVLRERTERPEGIASGNMRLAGTVREEIVGEVTRLLTDAVAYAAMSSPTLPYGDGHAGPRIAAAIEDWLERHLQAEERLIA